MKKLVKTIYAELLDSQQCPGQLSLRLSIPVATIFAALEDLKKMRLVKTADKKDIDQMRQAWRVVTTWDRLKDLLGSDKKLAAG